MTFILSKQETKTECIEKKNIYQGTIYSRHKSIDYHQKENWACASNKRNQTIKSEQ